jgi:hypothetical protein
LIELLVALTVLALMLGLVGQITAAVGRAWSDTRNRTDNFTRARAALELMARDLQAGVFRTDLPVPLSTPLTFFSRRPGTGGSGNSRRLSLVRYETVFLQGVEAGRDEVFLRRLDSAVDWDAAAGLFVPGAPGTPLPVPVQAQDVFPGICLLQVHYRDELGNVQTTFSSTTPRSVVAYIALAVVDQDSQRLLNAAQWQQIQDRLNAAGVSAVDWRAAMDETSFFNGYPDRLRSGIRVFERTVVLP